MGHKKNPRPEPGYGPDTPLSEVAAFVSSLKAPQLTLEEWRLACAAFLKSELHLDDLLDEDDPYDLFDAMVGAFELGKSPAEFIKGMFAEDMARAEHDVQQAAESLEHNGDDL